MSSKVVKAEQQRDPFAVAFGERLRDARQAKLPKMTQDDLGAQIGAKKANISQWENGSHMPDLKSLRAICDTLGCSADTLLGRVPGTVSAAAMEEARAYDALPKDQQHKWRAMRLTLFAPA